MDLFKKNRVKIQDLLQDTLDLIQKKYNQSSQIFTVASAWGQILFVLQNLTQLILFFIEDSITELNIKTASRDSSVYSWAALTGHNASRASAARGQIQISWNGTDPSSVGGGAILIPKYAQIKTKNGNSIYVINSPQDYLRINLNKSGNSSISCEIMEGTVKSAFFTGTGRSLQSYNVSDRVTSAIDNFEVQVYVNSEQWKVYDSLYDIPFNAKGVLIKTGISSGIDVIFGTGKFGMVAPLGSTIRVQYLETSGTQGNINAIAPNNIALVFNDSGTDIFGNDVTLESYLNVTCTIPPQLGTDQESIALTKILAPKTSRSYVLANPENYITYFEKFGIFSIIEAFTTYKGNYIDDTNIIYVLLVPDISKTLKTNQTYFDIPESNFILSSYQKDAIYKALADSGQQIVTTEVSLVDPKISRYVINILMTIFEGYDPVNVKSQIIDMLSSYFLSIRRRDKIPRSDLIAIIESIPGVDSITLFFLSEKNEKYAISVSNLPPTNPATQVTLGFDAYGDIVFEQDEIVIISGGWADRAGLSYDKGVDLNKLSSVNIDITGTTPITYNTQINTKNKLSLQNVTTNTNNTAGQ
jgi:hypothetical protein